MIRLILLCALVGALTGCGASSSTGAAVSSAPTPSAAPTTSTPDPTVAPTATPSPSPSASLEDLARAYLVVADAFNATICEGNAILGAAETDAEYFEAAMTTFGAGVGHLAAFRDGLMDIGLESQFGSELDAIVEAIEERRAAYAELAAASTLDEAGAIFDERVFPANERMNAAGQAMRTALELPPRPEDACEREVVD